MTINSINRLLSIGNRILKFSQLLFKHPILDWELKFVRNLFTDPTIQLSELLNSIYSNPSGDEIIEDQLPVPESTSQFVPYMVPKTSNSESSILPIKTDDGIDQNNNNLLKPIITGPDFSSLFLSSMLPSVATVFKSMTALNIQPSNRKKKLEGVWSKQGTTLTKRQSQSITEEKKLQHENIPPVDETEDIKKVINKQNSTETNWLSSSKAEDIKSPDRKAVIANQSVTEAEVLKDITPPGLRMARGPTQIANVLRANIATDKLTEAATSPPGKKERAPMSPSKRYINIIDPPAEKIQPPGLRMARDPTRIADVLRANIATDRLTETPTSTQEKEQAAPMSSLEKEVNITDIPDKENQPLFKSQLDIEQLLEKLADQLEFELLRTYGTSGR